MTVLLVRHGIALDRAHWDGPDEERPLRKRGHRQAEGLAELLRAYEVTRVLSSPALRCVQTVVDVAKTHGVAVERSDALAEGATHEAMDLLRSLVGVGAVLCSHGDVIPRVLEHLVVEDGVELGPDPRWAKGSTWALHDDGAKFVKAVYLDPPD